MRHYRGTVATDQQSSDVEFEFSAEDDATQEEIAAEARDWALQHVEWSFELVTGPVAVPLASEVPDE